MESIKLFGSNTWRNLSTTFGGDDQEDLLEPAGSGSLLGQLNEATTLSRMQRLIGFGVMFGIGLFFSFISQLFMLNPRKFGVCYTIGNLLSLGSMMFLMGPVNQIKNMFHKARWVATLLYLGALIGTLVSAIYYQSALLTLIFICLQFCAMIWYSISYIPYARQVIMKMLGACFAD
mmetsp:Transcript_9601/g.24456  ORF Transcript_9601/g.24456 Transcript_9601/m.24456 type:complete len:176 (+) Transcript_9601:356-883(+)|eukprot:jgi/Tetstr1/461313/TSEL_006440.t1